MQWYCVSCTFENHPDLLACEMCSRPQNVTPKESWVLWNAKNLPPIIVNEEKKISARQRADEDLLEYKNFVLNADCKKYVDNLPKLSEITDWQTVLREAPDINIVYNILQCEMLRTGFSVEYRTDFCNFYKQLKKTLAHQKAEEARLYAENLALTDACNSYVYSLPELSNIFNWQAVFENAPDKNIVYNTLHDIMLKSGYSADYRTAFRSFYQQLQKQ